MFGMAAEELALREGADTAREISGQPALWRAVADLLEARSGEVREFLKAPFQERNLLVVFTGAGSSSFAGGIVAAEGTAAAGREMRRIATTDLVEGWSRHLDPERPLLLVSFGRSGDSPESVAAVEIVDRACATVWHLALTCNPDGALARSAVGPRRLALVMPEGSCDQGFAMTGSFTAMTLAALAIFTCDAPEAGGPIVRRLAAEAEHLLAAWPEVAALAAARHERIVYLGSGALLDAAAECALKLLELTDGEVLAAPYSPLAFRHGPKTIIRGDRTLVVSLIAGDPAVRPYGVDMALELAGDGRADLLALVPEPSVRVEGLPAFAALRDGPLPGDGWLAVQYVLVGQMLAFFNSLQRGYPTDRPSRSGEVNRVVQNVTIHG